MTENVLSEIRSRGYWEVIIRPNEFNENRIPGLRDLESIVRHCSVLLRGWSFPVRPTDQLQRADEWIGEEKQSRMHLELWRMYKSGQFVYVGGFWDDWIDRDFLRQVDASWKPGQRILVAEVMGRFLDVYEFMSRLVLTPAGSPTMNLDLKAVNLKGRRLMLAEPGRGELDPRILDQPASEYKRHYDQSELISRPRELALEASLEFFRSCDWDPSMELLRNLQSNWWPESGR